MINKDITINGIKFTKKELAKGIDRNKIPVPHHWEDKDGNYICDFNSLAPRIKEYESRELHLIMKHGDNLIVEPVSGKNLKGIFEHRWILEHWLRGTDVYRNLVCARDEVELASESAKRFIHFYLNLMCESNGAVGVPDDYPPMKVMIVEPMKVVHIGFTGDYNALTATGDATKDATLVGYCSDSNCFYIDPVYLKDNACDALVSAATPMHFVLSINNAGVHLNMAIQER